MKISGSLKIAFIFCCEQFQLIVNEVLKRWYIYSCCTEPFLRFVSSQNLMGFFECIGCICISLRKLGSILNKYSFRISDEDVYTVLQQATHSLAVCTVVQSTMMLRVLQTNKTICLVTACLQKNYTPYTPSNKSVVAKIC